MTTTILSHGRVTWTNIIQPTLEDIEQILRTMLDEHMDVIDGLSDTIDTLASHRIDGVVRVLTFITILTAPLTLMATIFGINVELLPVRYHPYLFLAVIIIGVLLTVGLVIYLNRRGFLWERA